MDPLYIVFIVIAAALIFGKRVFVSKDMNNVTAEEAYQLIKDNKDILVIDVRTPQEYKSGHIAGAKNIPVNEISSRIGELEKYKEKPILVHCASGSRSPKAVNILQKNDFKNVYHLNRGLLQWKYGLK